MPNESFIDRIEQQLGDMARLGGQAERTAIFTNVTVIDASPAGLTNRVIIEDPRDGDYVPALKVPGVTYSNSDLVNVLFIVGTEPIAFQQASGSTGAGAQVSDLWESDFDAIAWSVDSVGDLSAAGAYDLTTTGEITAHTFGFVVKNTSGAAASAGDVGYIDNAGEYKTTTTAQDDVPWCVVLVGGANNADIYVARRGRVTVNYTGSAPSTGDFLVTSTTGGSAQAQTTMRPQIFAVCLANGSGGTVSTLLLTGRIRRSLSIANELFQIVNASDSDFVAVVSAAGVSGDKVYHDPPSSGTQDAVTPFATNHLSNIVLHNTTQGEEAFIINAGTDGTDDFIQVSNSADISGWVTSDTITARSQTNTSTISSTRFFDMEITDLTNVPPLTTILDIAIHRLVDTGATGQQGNLHPYEGNSTPKRQTVRTIQTTSVGGTPGFVLPVPIIANRYCLEWDASGSGTFQVQLRARTAEIAVP